ncbi:MAG TPA: CAP-associated domain-containing protein [Planococcus sp. (in: firmicutes)]|nr:CAP-associated domain-containing protein [Planococcus sp. (in: firmicutes)]
MKNLLRIVFFLLIILFAFLYLDPSIIENEMLEAPRMLDPLPTQNLNEIPVGVERPDEGVSVYISGSSEKWLSEFGMPDRIEPSAYGYEWWVYNQSYSNYVMAGVKNGSVVQVYTAGKAIDAAPYEIGQTLEDIHRFTIVENEVTVNFDDNIYTFSLTAEDSNTRLLVDFEEIYVQLYIDRVDGTLEAVRFMNAETLIRHQPYDMMFAGELLPSEPPSSHLQESIDEANAKQIIDLTNIYRLFHQRKPLSHNLPVSKVAKEHAENLARRNYSPGASELKDLNTRLTEANIDFEVAAENTATQYLDAAEAVHGWINSPDHRETMLNRDFNQIGVGVYGRHYAQSFLEREISANEQQ